MKPKYKIGDRVAYSTISEPYYYIITDVNFNTYTLFDLKEKRTCESLAFSYFDKNSSKVTKLEQALK